MTEPVFLTRESVEAIHSASIQRFGGSLGIRDENVLESALAQPLHEYYYQEADLFQMAAAYAIILLKISHSLTATNVLRCWPRSTFSCKMALAQTGPSLSSTMP